MEQVPNYKYKRIESSPLLNLASKMDSRTSNEYLDVTPEIINAQGFTFTLLENADLFNSKALSTRLGNINVCDNVSDVNGYPSGVITLFSGVPAGTFSNGLGLGAGPAPQSLPGMIFIPSGNMRLVNGVIQVHSKKTAVPLVNYEYQLNALVYEMNQTNLPASGVAYMSGLYGLGSGIRSLIPSAIPGGGYINPPTYYPQIVGSNLNLATPPVSTAPSFGFKLPLPVAISDNTSKFNFNTRLTNSGVITDIVDVPINFTAPYILKSGVVYNIAFNIVNNSLFQDDLGYVEIMARGSFTFSSYNDYSPNTSASVLSNRTYGSPGNFTRQENAVNMINSTDRKFQLVTQLNEYHSSDYILTDKPTSSFMWAAPIISGKDSSNRESNIVNTNTTATTPVNTQFNGLSQEPPVDTTQVEFGELVYVPSGTYTLYGGYFYANAFSGINNFNNQPYNSYTRNKANFPLKGYNVGYTANISRVLETSGVIRSGTYTIKNRDILATFNGSYTFNDPLYYSSHIVINNDVALDASSSLVYSYPNVTGFNIQEYAINYNQNKLYAIYDNPPTVTSNGEYYLMSFKFFDSSSFDDLTDYVSTTSTSNNQTYTSFSSPLLIGMEKNNTYSGTFVYNRSNDGLTFKQLENQDTYNLGISGNAVNLSCGLIYLQSGIGITSIYDYRVEDNRSQRVVVTQKDKILASTLDSCKWTTILSGAEMDNNYKWSHTTYQNNLISHQYSKSSGVVWDQIYLNPSGNSMQLHGLRPSFSLTGVALSSGYSTVSPIASGSSISVILATQLGTGGLRASLPQTYTNTFNTSGVFKLNGNDIYNPTGVSQYNFDVLPQATYVFATQPSGFIYYLAGLVNNSGVALSNPLPNTNSFNQNNGGVYINDVSTTGLQQQIPQIISYDQQYLTDQVDVPMFKKVGVYRDMVIGAGDPNNPSRLWYGQQFTANIFGVDGKYCGYIDIDLGNGSPITAFEIYRDYLIVFKYNSAYRLAYTGDPSNPFQVYKISDTIGSLGFFSTVSTDYGIFGLSQFGPFLANNVGAETIGDEIVPYYDDLDHTDLTFSVAIHDRLRQQIYWSISSKNDSPYNNIGLCYSYAEKAWNIRKGGMWNVAGIIQDEDNFNRLYTGDSLGQLQQISIGSSNQDELFTDVMGVKLTKNISLTAETPWLNFGNSMYLKQLKNIRVNCETSNQRIRVDVYIDQNPVKKYTRYLNMNAPVINRLISLAGTCRTAKFVFTTVGDPAPVKINSLQIAYTNLGGRAQ